MTCSCLPGSNLLPDIKEWQKSKDFQLSQSILQTWRLRPESGSNLPPSFRLPGKGALSWAGPGAACSVLDSSTSGLGEVTETKPIEICNPIPKLTGQCAGPKPPASSSSSRGAPLPPRGCSSSVFIPSRQGPAGSGKATSGTAQLWWRNSRAAPQWPSAWESTEVFLSPPPCSSQQLGPNSCEKSPGGNV